MQLDKATGTQEVQTDSVSCPLMDDFIYDLICKPLPSSTLR